MSAKRMTTTIVLEVKVNDTMFPQDVAVRFTGLGPAETQFSSAADSSAQTMTAMRALSEAVAEAYANFVQAVSS